MKGALPAVEVDYVVPFNDVDVMGVVWYGNYIYTVLDKASGETLTKGHTVQFAISTDSGEAQYAAPQAILDRVRKQKSE